MKKCDFRYEVRPASSKGFTLVELLVAQVIFLILLIVIVQMIVGLTQNAQRQKNRMDSLAEARQVLDRLSLDWASRVRRNDVSAYLLAQTGNDQFSLLSQVASYSGTSSRNVSAVTYRVNPATYALERGVAGYTWSGGGPSLPIVQPTQPATNGYEPMAGSIFRMETCYLQQAQVSGTARFTVSGSSFIGSGTDSSSVSLTSPNLGGIVVAFAMLDQLDRQKIPAGQLLAAMDKLSKALPDAVDDQDPQSLWIGLINTPNSSYYQAAAAAGIPQTVAGAVRIYQRVYFVNE